MATDEVDEVSYNCRFEEDGDGVISLRGLSTWRDEDSVIYTNDAVRGGAMFHTASSSTYRSSVFIRNVGWSAGAIYVQSVSDESTGSAFSCVNCTFQGNKY